MTPIMYNINVIRKEMLRMKIFVSGNHITAHFIYKVLLFIKTQVSKRELLFYIDEVYNHKE